MSVTSIRYEMRRLRLMAMAVRGPAVLDIGYRQLPNPWLSDFETVGLDIEPPNEKPAGYRDIIVGDATRLAEIVGETRFDSIVAGEFIEHLENPYDFLRSARSVLKSSGHLILSTPNPLGFPTFFAEMLRTRKYFYSEDHAYYLLPRWVERMLERTGFEITNIQPVGLWLPMGYVPIPVVPLSYQIVYTAHPTESPTAAM